MLELHEIVSMSHVVACQIDFKLLCAQGQLGGVVKLTKNDYFLVFLTIQVLFPKFLGRLSSGLYQHCIKTIRMSHVIT